MPLSKADLEYLEALRKARLAIVSGAQEYSVGSRSLKRADLAFIAGEIARLEGTQSIRVRRIIPTDR